MVSYVSDYDRLFQSVRWKELQAVDGPWAYLATGTVSEVASVVMNYRHRYPDAAPGVRTLRGTDCSSKRRLLPSAETVDRMAFVDAWSLFALVANSVGVDDYDTRRIPYSGWLLLLFGDNYRRVMLPRSPYVSYWPPTRLGPIVEVLAQG